jgi:hypothetical protein
LTAANGTPKPETLMFIDRIRELVAVYEDGWLGLMNAESTARLRFALDPSSATERDWCQCRLAIDQRHADDALYAQVEEALLAAIDDPWLVRSLEIIWSRVAAARGDAACRRRLIELDTSLESRRIADYDWLLTGLYEARLAEVRSESWHRMQQLGARLAPQLLEQARLRREHAQELGYSSWTIATLDLDGLPAEALLRGRERLIEALDAHDDSADDLRCVAAGRADGSDRVSTPREPWDFLGLWGAACAEDHELSLHLAGRDPVELVQDTFDALGLELGDLLSARLPLPGRTPGGSLIFASGGKAQLAVDGRQGLPALRGLLSATGWALGHVCADPTLPRLLRAPAHRHLGEAVARLTSRLVDNPFWLERVAGHARALEEAGFQRLMNRNRACQRRYLQFSAVAALLGDRLDAGAVEELPEQAWELARRFLSIERPADWEPGGEWALWPSLIQGGDRSLLREGLAAQLAAGLARVVGPAGLAAGPEAGGWLADRVLQHGASLHWEDLIEQATGEPFSYGWVLLRAGVPLPAGEEPVDAQSN